LPIFDCRMTIENRKSKIVNRKSISEIMMRKFVILGLLLLLVGAVALKLLLAEKTKEQKQAAYYKSKHNSELSEHLKLYKQWLNTPPQERTQLPLGLDKHGKTKTKAQTLQEQHERLKADLDKLAAGEMDSFPYADILYGENWRGEVSKYIKQKEQREFVFTCSVLLMSIGGGILTCSLLILIAQLVFRGISCLKKFLAHVFTNRKESQGAQPAKADADVENEKQNPPPNRSAVPLAQLLGLKGMSPKTGQQTSPRASSNSYGRTPAVAGTRQADEGRPYRPQKAPNIALLLTAEAAMKSDKPLTIAEGSREAGSQKALSTNTMQLANSLTRQVENLEKQVQEIRQMAGDSLSQKNAKSSSAQGVKQAIGEYSESINDTLMELTQQVAAIREYASGQQGRVEKLQEGYDLNIIKNFCLRVIRCIDNVDGCIGRQSEQDSQTMYLKEVRDELLFALESSGVEQFAPEINSEYRGQERLVEAVKEKEHCDDPLLSGKIAQVIKPGYQYFVDEQNVKIVRPAMVKLFG